MSGLFLLLSVPTPPAVAQVQADRAPWGSQIQVAAATLGGNGMEVGVVSARSVYTREIMILADLEPLWRPSQGQARVVLMPALSLRLLGFERLIGGAAYRGMDVDIGLRAGPGLSFAGNETLEERNRRFELVLDPFLRVTSVHTRSLAWLLEIGSSRPALRLGVWIRY